jgi:hypothetical protein
MPLVTSHFKKEEAKKFAIRRTAVTAPCSKAVVGKIEAGI